MLKMEKIKFDLSGKEIFLDLNFNMEGGEIVVITGQNGSGKSTLAKIIMGIYKPKLGKVYFKGMEISGLDIEKRADLGIAYSFQQAPVFRGISVYKLLCLAAKKELGLFEAERVLRKVGLDPVKYLKRIVDKTLSGGEIKRVELASVLAADKDLMIFDEPEAGIDLWSFNHLLTIFLELKKKGKAILIISHQMRLIEKADRAMMIEEGKLVEYGKEKDNK